MADSTTPPSAQREANVASEEALVGSESGRAQASRLISSPDGTSTIAASLAIVAEHSPRSARGRLRDAAIRLGRGEDPTLIARRLPRRWANAFRLGAEAHCVVELMEALRDLQTSRDERGRAAAQAWTYPFVMFAFVTLALIGVTWFGWAYLLPFEQEVSEPIQWMASGWTRQAELRQPYFIYLIVQTVYVAACSLICLAGLCLLLWNAFSSKNRTTTWSFLLWNGRAVRKLAARQEITHLLSVFVEASYPLNDAFNAIDQIATSSIASAAAARCRKLASYGDDPRPEFPRAELLYGTRQDQPGLTPSDLRNEAMLCRLACLAKIEQVLPLTALAVTIMTAALVVLAFLTVVMPNLLFTSFFS